MKKFLFTPYTEWFFLNRIYSRFFAVYRSPDIIILNWLLWEPLKIFYLSIITCSSILKCQVNKCDCAFLFLFLIIIDGAFLVLSFYQKAGSVLELSFELIKSGYRKHSLYLITQTEISYFLLWNCNTNTCIYMFLFNRFFNIIKEIFQTWKNN